MCPCQGNEIFCLSIPGPISIVILGIQLQVTIPPIQITAQQPLSAEDKALLARIMGNVVSVKA